MHNTTHYRRLMLCVIMLMMMITTGCPGGNKQKETSPKKSNGKTLDHYKQIVQDKFPNRGDIPAKNDSERKQKILAYATTLAVLDDNEKAVDEGLEATSAAMLLEGLRIVLIDIDPPCATLVELGITAAASKAKPIKEEKKRIRADIRKKSKKFLDNLLNAEGKKVFVNDYLTESLFIPITVAQGDLETMRLLVKAGLDLRKTGCDLLSCARDSGQTEMVKFLEDNGAK